MKDIYSVRKVTDIEPLTSDMELVCTIISCKHFKILCCVVYLPPDYKDDQYLNVLNSIENVIITHAHLDVLLLGDFNLNSCSANVSLNFVMLVACISTVIYLMVMVVCWTLY